MATLDNMNDNVKMLKQESHRLLHDQVMRTRNIFTNSTYFKNLCSQVFVMVDSDKSNSVDVKELYIAILLLYLKLALVVAGLSPPTEAHIMDMLVQYGYSKTSQLDLNDFTNFASILLQNIVTRVVLQAIFVLVVVPMAAAKLMSIFCGNFTHICSKIPSPLLLTLFSSTIVIILTPYLISTIQWLFLPHTESEISKEKTN